MLKADPKTPDKAHKANNQTATCKELDGTHVSTKSSDKKKSHTRNGTDEKEPADKQPAAGNTDVQATKLEQKGMGAAESTPSTKSETTMVEQTAADKEAPRAEQPGVNSQLNSVVANCQRRMQFKDVAMRTGPVKRTLPAERVKFSQSTVGRGCVDIANNMAREGFRTKIAGQKRNQRLDVVVMKDGSRVSIDNRRLAAASLAKTAVKVHEHDSMDKLPAGQHGRFGNAKTWGEAVEHRINQQTKQWRKANPQGAPTPSLTHQMGDKACTRIKDVERLPTIAEHHPSSPPKEKWHNRAYRRRFKGGELSVALKTKTVPTIPTSVRQLKQQAKKQLKPRGHVGLSGICNIIDNIDRKGGASVHGPGADAGVVKTRTRKMAVADARVFRAGARWSVFEANAEALSASASASVGVDGVHAQASATVVRAEASAGLVRAGVGLQFDTGIGVGPTGLDVSVAGFGFSLGPRVGIKLPFLDLTIG